MFRKLEAKLSKSLDKKVAYPAWGRGFFIILGFLSIACGVIRLQRVLTYTDLRGQVTFSSALIGTGIVFLLIGCLPSGDRVYRLITTRTDKPKRTLDEELRASHLKHPSKHSRNHKTNKL